MKANAMFWGMVRANIFVVLFCLFAVFSAGTSEAHPWKSAVWSESVPKEDRFHYERRASVWQVMVEKEHKGAHIDIFRVRVRWTDPVGNIFVGQSDGRDVSFADRPHSLRITDVSGLFPEETTAYFHGGLSGVSLSMVQARDVSTYLFGGVITYISGMEVFFTIAWDPGTRAVMKYGENTLAGVSGFRWPDEKSMRLAKEFRDKSREEAERRRAGYDEK